MAIDPALAKRLHQYPLPPPDFDPTSATERMMEEYGLPTRPSADKVESLDFWTLLFSAPLRFIKPEFDHEVLPPKVATFSIENQQRGRPSPRIELSNRDRFDKSRNWSGLYLKASKPDRFSSVGAAWTVPTVDVPAVPPINPAPGDPARDEYRSSVWIGLNGTRAYPHVTIPQIGTWQRLKEVNGQKVIDNAAWWQWWSRDEVTPIVKFANFPVTAGDLILSGLCVVSSDEVVFFIKNQTTGDFTWVLVQAPSQGEPLGMTAEWIVERPTTPGFIWPWRLPKLSDVTFSYCHALAGPRLIGPQSLHRLEQARFIRMQERFERPYRSALIEIAERTSATSARVQFQEG